jgi:hypothetical protein
LKTSPPYLPSPKYVPTAHYRFPPGHDPTLVPENRLADLGRTRIGSAPRKMTTFCSVHGTRPIRAGLIPLRPLGPVQLAAMPPRNPCPVHRLEALYGNVECVPARVQTLAPLPHARRKHYSRSENLTGNQPKRIEATNSDPIFSRTEISSPSRTVCGTIAAAMTPDIVANALVAALTAGAVAGATDTAKS